MMFKQNILALIKKELLATWQDKKTRMILILPPIIQLFVFAFCATLDVKNATIGILNLDSGKPAYELVQRFQGCPIFSKIIYLSNVKQIKDILDNQKALMVIHIDEQFSRNVLEKKEAKVQVLLDGRKSNSSQILLGYTNKIIAQYYLDLTKNINLPPPTTELIPRNWFNPNLIYMWFTVPGLVGILTMVTGILVTALSIARERELGTFEQLLVSPLRPIDILIGKMVPGVLIGIGEGSLILLAAISAFKIPFTSSFLYLYLAMLIFVLSIVGIGLFISSLSKTQQQALLGSFFFISNSVILSGFASPIENMPHWLQNITLINPLRYFMVIMRSLFLKNMSFSLLIHYLYPIAIIAIINLSIATWFFRRRLE